MSKKIVIAILSSFISLISVFALESPELDIGPVWTNIWEQKEVSVNEKRIGEAYSLSGPGFRVGAWHDIMDLWGLEYNALFSWPTSRTLTQSGITQTAGSTRLPFIFGFNIGIAFHYEPVKNLDLRISTGISFLSTALEYNTSLFTYSEKMMTFGMPLNVSVRYMISRYIGIRAGCDMQFLFIGYMTNSYQSKIKNPLTGKLPDPLVVKGFASKFFSFSCTPYVSCVIYF